MDKNKGEEALVVVAGAVVADFGPVVAHELVPVLEPALVLALAAELPNQTYRADVEMNTRREVQTLQHLLQQFPQQRTLQPADVLRRMDRRNMLLDLLLLQTFVEVM